MYLQINVDRVSEDPRNATHSFSLIKNSWIYHLTSFLSWKEHGYSFTVNMNTVYWHIRGSVPIFPEEGDPTRGFET